MLKNPDFLTARAILLEQVKEMATETVSLETSFSRILAEDILATENVPPFDRSPYDGYALRSKDSEGASKDVPVTLRVIEKVPAGKVPTMPCGVGEATNVMTGAPIPCGADTVIMFEKTAFTEREVTLFAPLKPSENIVFSGEDVKKGALLVHAGTKIDAGVAGTLAAQGIAEPTVYRMPKVGMISTGNEITELSAPLEAGKIYDSNRYMLAAAIKEIGCDPLYLGLAEDSAEGICALIKKGLAHCDALITTGGVSVGDYDLVPKAMELAQIALLFRGADIKPGMACAYGEKDGKIICGLSGNPASSLTNFWAIAAPALKKLAGRADAVPEEMSLVIKNGFKKKSPGTRLLRGRLVFSDGLAVLDTSKDQGNVILSSTIGCDAMAVVPAGSGPIAEGTTLRGFRL
jgi:molybdenum cofactor synthesis domain